MKLPAFTLLERSLRLESRSPLMCWTRAGLLGVILFVLFPIQTSAQLGMYGAPGLRFLTSMFWVNFLFITLAGLSYFASAITEEKEETMLGLLRMTGLNGVAILLGKSTSRLVGALLLLLVQVPFILLAVTLGGVGILQIAAAYGMLLAYTFLLCNLALLFSVVFRNTATAAGITLLFLLMFFVGPYWGGAIEDSLASHYHADLDIGGWEIVTTMFRFWREATPFERVGAVFGTGFAGPVIGFQVVSNLIAGVLLFLLAWLLFDTCTREEKDAAPVHRLFWRRRASRRSRIPPYLVGAPAITWKDFTFISGGKFGLILKFAVLGLVVGLFNVILLESGDTITREGEGAVLIWVSVYTTAVWLAVEASRIFKDEIRWKTLSSLMMLPISVRELAYRKVVGTLAGTLPLLVCFVVGEVIVPHHPDNIRGGVSTAPQEYGWRIMMVLQYILFLHLTAFLSLVLKRGALPLAIAIQYLGGSIFMGFFSFFMVAVGGPSAIRGIVYISGIVCVLLTVPLHFAIGYRLERAAAEE